MNYKLKKKVAAIFLLFVLCLLLISCSKQNLDINFPVGTFKAIDAPQTGETVVEIISFSEDSLTMASGNSRQEVPYKIEGDKLHITTAYGDFSFDFKWEDQHILLDGVTYVLQ